LVGAAAGTDWLACTEAPANLTEESPHGRFGDTHLEHVDGSGGSSRNVNMLLSDGATAARPSSAPGKSVQLHPLDSQVVFGDSNQQVFTHVDQPKSIRHFEVA
jgi:hypothetical protein